MKNKLICSYCGKSFDHMSRFRSHLIIYHKYKNQNLEKSYFDNNLKTDNNGNCHTCGKPTEFVSLRIGYRKFCCSTCRKNYSMPKEEKTRLVNKVKQTKLERYGDPNYNNFDKNRKTCLEKYGVDSYNKTDEMKKYLSDKKRSYTDEENKIIQDKRDITKQERFGDPHYNNRQKALNTTVERYGVINISQTEQWKEKIRETCLRKYGVEHYTRTDWYKEKLKSIILEMYGVEYVGKLEKFKNRAKETNLQKYGVEHWSQTDWGRKKLSDSNKNRSDKNCGYSKVSQLLFDIIYEIIKDDFREIHYATKNKSNAKNQEYHVMTTKGIRFLDFFITDNEKCIEFDGEYWHNENTELKDLGRELAIKESKPNIKILHIKERDFYDNQEEVINTCVQFIYE